MRKTLLTTLTMVALVATPAMLPATADTVAATESTVTNNAHTAWTNLLAKYVVEADDGVNRFDYGALKANEADAAALDAYIGEFSSVDIDAL